MKPIIIFLALLLPITFFGLNAEKPLPPGESMPANNKINCQSAVEMSCQTTAYFSGNFSDSILTETNARPECVVQNGSYELREFWIELNLNGYMNYFLDGNGVNGGFEIYSGTCDELQLVECEPAQGNNTYYAFYTPQFNQYYVRVTGYDYNGGSYFNMVLNCFSPMPTCDISIDNIAVAPCMDENDLVQVDLSGIVHGANSDYPVYMEMLTDEGIFFSDGSIVDTVWSGSFLVSGTSISYISIGTGNSENYCSDTVSSIALPEIQCGDNLSALIGNVVWNASCQNRAATVSLFSPNTNVLIDTYEIQITNNGHFQITEPAIGQFDMILKVDGCLAKGFSDVTIGNENLNTVDCGVLIRGEVTGDNVINVIDLSVINEFFGQVITDSDPDSIDLNCDGAINIVDVSVIGSAFGMVGDTAPM